MAKNLFVSVVPSIAGGTTDTQRKECDFPHACHKSRKDDHVENSSTKSLARETEGDFCFENSLANGFRF
jgi:hypothetical protein